MAISVNIQYEKTKVIQALRYHFITRPEIKVMIIVVNVFAIVSLALYAFKKITPTAFLLGSLLWIVLMVSFWFILPWMVYKRANTFKSDFEMLFYDDEFILQHGEKQKSWEWKSLNNFLETPNFFHLYFDSRTFFLVPKSGCKNPEELSQLRKMLYEKIKG